MISLGQIAEMLNGELAGNPQCTISGAGPLDQAVEGQITFAEKGQGLKQVAETKATAVIVPKGFSHPDINLIQVNNPRFQYPGG